MRDDTISRAAAISNVKKLCEGCYLSEHCGKCLTKCLVRKSINQLKKVPPSQPYVPDTNVGDMISRQAAIQTAERMYRRCDTSSIEDYHDLMVDALTVLPSAQPGWIPCSRELPKPNEEDGNGFYKAYLVQDGRWMDVARWDGKYWIAWGYSTVLLNVVAWCELPKPWEGDTDAH
jgi:hypothetical protein